MSYPLLSSTPQENYLQNQDLGNSVPVSFCPSCGAVLVVAIVIVVVVIVLVFIVVVVMVVVGVVYVFYMTE